jgi:hypothetical protein
VGSQFQERTRDGKDWRTAGDWCGWGREDNDCGEADNLLEGDTANPERHPIAIALRRQDDVDDARVTKSETLVRRGKKWFRYDAPDKRLFKQLQKTLTASPD